MGLDHRPGADKSEVHAHPHLGSAAGRNQRGLLTGSLALVAAAGHLLTDVLGLGMALVAIRRDRFRIGHATIQIEQPDHTDDGACCTLDPRCRVVGRRSFVSAGTAPKE